jgi:hypothetical protein
MLNETVFLGTLGLVGTDSKMACGNSCSRDPLRLGMAVTGLQMAVTGSLEY